MRYFEIIMAVPTLAAAPGPLAAPLGAPRGDAGAELHKRVWQAHTVAALPWYL